MTTKYNRYVGVNCVKTARTQLKHNHRIVISSQKEKNWNEKRVIGDMENNVGDSCGIKMFHESEGFEPIKLSSGEVKSSIERVTYAVDYMEYKLERIGEKMCHIEQNLSEIVNEAAIEEIVIEVVQAVSARQQGRKNYRVNQMGMHPTLRVTCLREGNQETLQVEERVKRMVQNMEVKQSKCKGRKPKLLKLKPKLERFAITGLISGKNADLLKFLFHRKSVGEDKWSKEIARCGEFSMTRMDFQCLSPAKNLSCKVINLCAAYLNDDSDCWFLPTFFGERARFNEESSSSRNWLECTIRMCGLKKFHRRLHMCSKIFIPLRDSMDDHWFLFVINLDEQSALLWDSLPDANSMTRRMHHARDVMALLQKVLSLEMTMFGDVFYNIPSFSVTLAKRNPTNTQEYDSGLFVIRHMQHYLDAWSRGFISEEHHNRIALEIVQNLRNEHRREVLAAVGGQTLEHANLLNPPTGRKSHSHRKRRDCA